jgi:hypothetical protein
MPVDASISCGRDISCDTRMPATRDPARPNIERWWGGKVIFDRAAPWPVVTAQHQLLLRAAGQTPLWCAQAAAADKKYSITNEAGPYF